MSTQISIPADQRQFTAWVRPMRALFEQATGLRSYNISWVQRGATDLFEADAPWGGDGIGSETALLEWLAEAERRGIALDFEIRSSRMTIRVAEASL